MRAADICAAEDELYRFENLLRRAVCFQINYRRDFFRTDHFDCVRSQEKYSRRVGRAQAVNRVGEFGVEALDRDKKKLLPRMHRHSLFKINQRSGHLGFFYLLRLRCQVEDSSCRQKSHSSSSSFHNHYNQSLKELQKNFLSCIIGAKNFLGGKIYDKQRNNFGGRERHAPLSADGSRFETINAGLRQADDLLSAVDVDACGHSGSFNHHDAARQSFVSSTARRRNSTRLENFLRRPAQARRFGASISYR